MPLTPPNLDDRSFADLVAEAKTLIPRYAPEWTDHNESDPGITLIQLFAWMTEILLYRLNRVPELNYIKFLQLLGVELQPARPARGELTFTLARDDLDAVIVPQGTQVAVADGGGGEPLMFESDNALIALGATLKEIQSFDGYSYTSETSKNAASGQWYQPFGPLAREGSSLLLGFASPLPFTSEQVNLAVYIPTEGLQPEGQLCAPDLEQLPPPALLVWEYWDCRLNQWQPLSMDKDETRAFTRSGHVYFTGPGDQVGRTSMGEVKEKLYWLRVRLDQSSYERSPNLEMVLVNTIGATQAITVRDEVVGGSNGRPHQNFRLANNPILVLDQPEKVSGPRGLRVTVESLRLEIDEGQGFAVWQEVSDFFASKPDDPHYVLNRTSGEIRFGDGQHGRIPVANTANPNANLVARLYRFGGGKKGNVAADKITELQTYVEGVKKVTNLRPAHGGANEETLEEAKLRAPRQLKSKERAVTAEDFELLALGTPGTRLRRAKALPLIHPKFKGKPIPGVVTVIVVPDSDAPNPTPNETTIRAVCACLNQHRLLTTEVYVVPPFYRHVSIEVQIVVRPEADLAEVKQAVEKRLGEYFHPLQGGDAGEGWPFGQGIYYSEVFREVLQCPGVLRIKDNHLFIWLDQERQPVCQDVGIEADELLYSQGHDVRVAYS